MLHPVENQLNNNDHFQTHDPLLFSSLLSHDETAVISRRRRARLTRTAMALEGSDWANRGSRWVTCSGAFRSLFLHSAVVAQLRVDTRRADFQDFL